MLCPKASSFLTVNSKSLIRSPLIIFPIFKIIFIDQHNFITRVLFLFIIIFVILFLLYKIIPDQNVEFLDTIKGAVVASIKIKIRMVLKK